MTAKVFLILVLGCKVCFSAIPVTNKEYASMPILFHQDNYDQCMLWEDEALYCAFEFVLEPLDSKNMSDTWKIIQNVSSDFWNYRHDHLRHWICVKETCPSVKKSHENDPVLIRDLMNCYNNKYNHLGLKGTVRNLTCEDSNPRYPIDWIDIAVATPVILYVCLVIYATYYEGMARFQSPEVYERKTNSPTGKLISSFALVKNWIRLTTITSTPEMDRWRCIQGIRTYNMALVVFAHTVMSFAASPLVNTQYSEMLYKTAPLVIISNAALAMTTIFMLSCFFLSKAMFEYSKNSREIEPKILLLAFLNRLMRLTPTLIFVTALHATWARHIGNGPNWNHTVGDEYLRCRQNWWTNILYLNTWIRPEKMCLAITWSLALDTQYFFIALWIIWILKKYESKLWWILGSLLALVILFTFWENYVYDFPPSILPNAEMNYDLRIILPNKQFHVQYTSFVGNFSGSVFGIGLGYYSYKYKDRRILTTKFRIFLWYCILYGLGFGIALIPWYIVFQSSIALHTFLASLLVATGRPIFALAMGVLIVGVSEGVGWMTKYILEWSPTYILGRLALSGYLTHLSIVMTPCAMSRGTIHVSNYAMLLRFLSNFSLTCLAALMLTLFVELPMSELWKRVMPDKKTEIENKLKNK